MIAEGVAFVEPTRKANDPPGTMANPAVWFGYRALRPHQEVVHAFVLLHRQAEPLVKPLPDRGQLHDVAVGEGRLSHHPRASRTGSGSGGRCTIVKFER